MTWIQTASYLMKTNLNFKAYIPINFAPKNVMLFIHKQSHNSFLFKHFVNEVILRLLHFLTTLYANQCHCSMLVINLNSWIKYSPVCSTTKRSTLVPISAQNTIHMYYGCLTSWQRRLLALDGEKYMLVVICTMSVHQLDHFDTVRHLNLASETEIFPSGNWAHKLYYLSLTTELPEPDKNLWGIQSHLL